MMKDIDYYMSLNYKIEVLKAEEGEGFVLYCPELKGCVTCADTVQKAFDMIEDAKKCWFLACIEEDTPIPEPGDISEYSGQFKLRMPKSLHKTLVENSRQEGISMNQYCLYLLSRGSNAAYNPKAIG